MRVNLFVASLHLLGATTNITSPNFSYHELPRKGISARDIFSNNHEQTVSAFGITYKGEIEIQKCFNRLVKEQSKEYKQ